MAKYDTDQKYYRARIVEPVERDDGELYYTVVYIDFGNRADVSAKDIHPLQSDFSTLPAQAIPCCLAQVRLPSH